MVSASAAECVHRGNSLELPADWLPKNVTREQALDALRPLLDLLVELVLPTHGAAYRPSRPRARALLTPDRG